MARFGKLPVSLTEGVKATIESGHVTVAGPKGTLELSIPRLISVDLKDNALLISKNLENKEAQALQGTIRSHLVNMVKGVTEGWKKELEISGPGYRAEVAGSDLKMNLGYSHPVVIKAPQNVTFKVEKSNITVEGIDKGVVGQVAALIRAARRADPYKMAGVKYVGEIVRRKAGKQATAAGA